MFVQVLAAYVAPDGAYTIASRNLLFVAREENDREREDPVHNYD